MFRFLLVEVLCYKECGIQSFTNRNSVFRSYFFIQGICNWNTGLNNSEKRKDIDYFVDLESVSILSLYNLLCLKVD